MTFYLARMGVCRGLCAAMSVSVLMSLPQAAVAQAAAYTQSLAEAAAPNDAVAAFYRARGYDPIWTGADDADRRLAFLTVLANAGQHGLPTARYDVAALAAGFRSAETEGDRGRLEARMTQAFLDYARDLQTGVLIPKQVDGGIVRDVPLRDLAVLLAGIAGDKPLAFLHDLAPQAPEYARLMKEKMALDRLLGSGGWGLPVQAASLKPGDTGDVVVQLRDRLVAMGYLRNSATQTYDKAIQSAVQQFQMNHGLISDGIAGEGTITEINVAPEARLQSVIVAMERLRWMGDAPRGARHVWVNLPDFTAKVMDGGKVTFQTRAVIGKNVPDQRTPEFSDVMEHMVVNPSWGVPRSILVKEYLPLLQRNPNAVGHLQVVDRNGRVVPRGAVNFAAYSAKSFPFGLRQPPSDGNALGKVKFMFPNPYNIYLHDTPAKDLFDNDVRAYSHGCIRLGDPFDFAYTLLARQVADPQDTFAGHLNGGRETLVKLEQSVPVHLVYFTAWPGAKGKMTYRRDVYSRDAAIFDALTKAGVVQRAVQG